MISLNKIIDFLKKIDKNFLNLKRKLDELIHQNGINFSKLGKLKNLALLHFIEKDTYYIDNIYAKKNECRSVEILSGIDVKLINYEFLKKWKNLNFFKIFQNQKESFINKICKLINDISDFSILYKLLNKNKDENEDKIELDTESILRMQATFEELMFVCPPEKYPNILDSTIDLIYFSDKKKVNLKNFIEEKFQNILDNQTINNIYINLSRKYSISDELTNIIVPRASINAKVIKL